MEQTYFVTVGQDRYSYPAGTTLTVLCACTGVSAECKALAKGDSLYVRRQV